MYSSFKAIFPTFISSLCQFSGANHSKHRFCAFHQVIGFINIGIYFPKVNFLHGITPFRYIGV